MTATEDYQAFLKENGLTEEAMQEGLRRVDEAGLSGTVPSCVFRGHSLIAGAGKGIFANQLIKAGFKAAPIFEEGRWTFCGRFTNHSNTPNTKAVLDQFGVHLVATQDIEWCHEITADYRQVMQAMKDVAVYDCI